MGTIYLPQDQRSAMWGQAAGNLAGAYLQQHFQQQQTDQFLQHLESLKGAYETAHASGAGGGSLVGGDASTADQVPDYSALYPQITAAAGNNPFTQRLAAAYLEGLKQTQAARKEASAEKHQRLTETHMFNMEDLAQQREQRMEQQAVDANKFRQLRTEIEATRAKMEMETQPLKIQEMQATIQEKQAQIAKMQQENAWTDQLGRSPDGAAGLEQLKQINPNLAGVISQVGNYQAKMPGAGLGGNSPFNRMIREGVAKYFPDYREGGYQIEQEYRDPKVGAGQTITRMTTSLQHLGIFVKGIAELGNDPSRLRNWLRNNVGTLIRQQNPELRSVLQTKDLLGEEFKKAFAGAGGGSVQELNMHLSNLSENMTPDEAQAEAKAITDLIGGQMTALKDRYNLGTGLRLNDEEFMRKFAPSSIQPYQSMGGAFGDAASPSSPPSAKQGGNIYDEAASQAAAVAAVKNGASKAGVIRKLKDAGIPVPPELMQSGTGGSPDILPSSAAGSP